MESGGQWRIGMRRRLPPISWAGEMQETCTQGAPDTGARAKQPARPPRPRMATKLPGTRFGSDKYKLGSVCGKPRATATLTRLANAADMAPPNLKAWMPKRGLLPQPLPLGLG